MGGTLDKPAPLRLQPYLRIARPDHWFKNVFMLPGVLLALYGHPELFGPALLWLLPAALASVCLLASSYYTLNEVLDAPTDALHPVKSQRPVPSGQVRIKLAYLQWAALAGLGLALAALINPTFLICAAALWGFSLIYNVPPLRAKDRMVLDVLVESVNNPLRLALGFYATDTRAIIPASIVCAFWMLGAFFMTVKRFAEYRLIGDAQRAAAYRASFAGYTEERLLVLATFYAVAFGLFTGIFLIRYRLELLATIPFVAGAIAWYIYLGLQQNSPAQYPERLFRDRGLMLWLGAGLVVAMIALYMDIPWLHAIFEPTESLLQETPRVR